MLAKAVYGLSLDGYGRDDFSLNDDRRNVRFEYENVRGRALLPLSCPVFSEVMMSLSHHALRVPRRSSARASLIVCSVVAIRIVGKQPHSLRL